MDLMQILQSLLQVIFIGVITAVGAWAVKYIDVKRLEIIGKIDNETIKKDLDILGDVITDCVIATNQTYVDNLKKQNIFSVEAQKTAFQMTFDAVKKILAQDVTEYLGTIFGDINSLITEKIEATVKELK